MLAVRLAPMGMGGYPKGTNTPMHTAIGCT